MFNEMFGTFLENLHSRATRGAPPPPHKTNVQFPKKKKCIKKKKKLCTKWRTRQPDWDMAWAGLAWVGLASPSLASPGLAWSGLGSSHSFAREQGNRIFAAGKRDCQIFDYPAAAPLTSEPLHAARLSLKIWRTGAHA